MALGKRYSTVFPLGQRKQTSRKLVLSVLCFQVIPLRPHATLASEAWLHLQSRQQWSCNLPEKKDKLRCVWKFWKMIPFYCSFSSYWTMRFSAEASSPAESAEGSQWLQHGRSESSSIVGASGGQGAEMMFEMLLDSWSLWKIKKNEGARTVSLYLRIFSLGWVGNNAFVSECLEVSYLLWLFLAFVHVVWSQLIMWCCWWSFQ